MFDRLAYQKAYRLANNNKHTKAYEKTKRGFLMRLYRNMQSRIEGVQKSKAHLYNGLNLLGREVFYVWAQEQPHFHILFEEWEKSGYLRKLAPSVDRINSKLGYQLDNMEWVTMSENSRRGANNRHATSSNT